MEIIARRFLIALIGAYLKLFPQRILSNKISSMEWAMATHQDFSSELDGLLDKRITCLDIGARGGPQAHHAWYGKWMRFILAEPDPSEAEVLRAQGFDVTENIVGERSGVTNLHLTKSPGCSSTLEPGGPMLRFYAGESDRFDVVSTVELQTRTIDQIVDELNLSIDVVKMDTQGGELAILEGIERHWPIVIQTEVLLCELYRNQPTFYDVAAKLYREGYVLCRGSMKNCLPEASERYSPRRRTMRGLPLLGEAWFIPDYMREKGQQRIVRNDLAWAALMLIHGQEDVLRHALEVLELPNAERIRSCLGLRERT